MPYGSMLPVRGDRLAVGAPGDRASRLAIEIYLRLTVGPGGYALLRSVTVMVHLISASGAGSGNVTQLRIGRDHADRSGGDLGVRPGESDSTPMVGGVLLVVLATIILALVLVWWLT
jgi:hypothetical protein